MVVSNSYGGYTTGRKVVTINVKVDFVHASEDLIPSRDNTMAHHAATANAFLSNGSKCSTSQPVRQI